MTYFQVMTYQMKTTGPIFSLFFVQDINIFTRENELLFDQGAKTCNTRTLKGQSEGIETGFSSLKKIDVKLSTVADRSLGQRTDKYKTQTDKKCGDSADITCKKS